MRKIFTIVLSLTLITLALPARAQEGHSISVRVNDGPETTIRLAYHVGNQQYLRDSLVTDSKGSGVFAGSETLAPGVYMIVLPDNLFFEFLIDEEQHFAIYFNKADPTGTLSVEGSEENSRFIAYQRGWRQLQEKAMGFSEQLNKARPGSSEALALREKLSGQETEMKHFLRKTEAENRGSLLGAIAGAVIPIEPPTPAIPSGSKNPDSLSRLASYIYFKDHFFDNIDFSQPGLIRSPVIGGKLEQFFSQVVVQMPDSIIRETDRLLAMSSINDDMFQYVAVWLMNRYASSEIMGHDAVVVHLADRVYLTGRAPWASDEYLTDLKERIERIRPNLIGNKAPELIMDSFAGHHVSLWDVKADFTILYFWESDCGHCKVATPKLKEYYDENRDKGIEVFAVCTRHDKPEWEKYIVENGLSWINGWDPERLSRFDYLYNVDSTPLIYILDHNKKIIAKRIGIDDVGKFIEAWRTQQPHQ